MKERKNESLILYYNKRIEKYNIHRFESPNETIYIVLRENISLEINIYYIGLSIRN